MDRCFYLYLNFETHNFNQKLHIIRYLQMDQPKKKLIHKLRYKYRLVIINDESFEEKLNFKLTPMNVFVGFSSAVVLFTVIIITLIFYTSLREYVPGYTDTKTKRNLQELLYKTDSLENALNMKEQYLKNVLGILNGGEGISDTSQNAAPKP